MSLSSIQTSQSVLGWNELRVAHTVVAWVSVDTSAMVTCVLSSDTLISVNTLMMVIHVGTLGTLAFE